MTPGMYAANSGAKELGRSRLGFVREYLGAK